ncbi:hypothetical protein [Haloarcula sp. CBA1129]|uniref:hypothetical protein n=1 Tax=Haloarcula sp. CBA1129 TaxID=1853684 RepID=UPI001247196C|nr:hypothetical protein [Haloarcula sp. CBA1129]KAA9399673.1 hypothetical protein Har1129_16185 [Haloarcula sp. CBA1129]
MDFGNATSTLASQDYVVDVALVMVGFVGPAAVKYGIETKMGKDLPDEAYGATVAVGGAVYGGEGRKVALGGGVHVVEALRERFTGDN